MHGPLISAKAVQVRSAPNARRGQPGSMEEFQFLATQGFVKLSAMQEMRQYPVFVSEEWAHVLAWSLSPTARRAALLCPLQASSAATHDPVCVRCLKAKNVHAFHRDLFVGRYVYLDGQCPVYLCLLASHTHTHTHTQTHTHTNISWA